MKKLLIISVVMVAVIGAAKAADPKETAVEAAKRYTTLMQSDRPIAAIETFWEFPELFQTIFGEDLKKHSAAEREEMKKTFLDMLRKVYANPQVAEMMKKATFGEFQGGEARDGKTTVKFTVKIGEDRLPNTLVFKQIEGKWRVVDAAANNPALMGESLGKAYKTGGGGATPLEFVKEMARGVP